MTLPPAANDPSGSVPFDDSPPEIDGISAYDERHFVTYLRLLDAAKEGADWREAVQIIFGFDPGHDTDRARRVYDSHLSRAIWMTQSGYQYLLDPLRK